MRDGRFTPFETVSREAAPSGYRWSALILGIVKSLPFQMRRASGPTVANAIR